MLNYSEIDVGDELPGIESMWTLKDVKAFLTVWHGGVDSSETRFTDAATAQATGFGGDNAIVPGPMGLCLLARGIFQWLPEARLEKLDVVFRSPTFQNTKHLTKGIVTDRSEDDTEIRLELDVYLEREDGQHPQRGAAVVVLPKS